MKISCKAGMLLITVYSPVQLVEPRVYLGEGKGRLAFLMIGRFVFVLTIAERFKLRFFRSLTKYRIEIALGDRYGRERVAYIELRIKYGRELRSTRERR